MSKKSDLLELHNGAQAYIDQYEREKQENHSKNNDLLARLKAMSDSIMVQTYIGKDGGATYIVKVSECKDGINIWLQNKLFNSAMHFPTDYDYTINFHNGQYHIYNGVLVDAFATKCDDAKSVISYLGAEMMKFSCQASVDDAIIPYAKDTKKNKKKISDVDTKA